MMSSNQITTDHRNIISLSLLNEKRKKRVQKILVHYHVRGGAGVNAVNAVYGEKQLLCVGVTLGIYELSPDSSDKAL